MQILDAPDVSRQANYRYQITIIGILFFVFGFVTWMNSILISFFKQAFGLDNTRSYLVTFAFFISYTVMAIPSSWLLQRTGFKKGMSYGLGIMALGTLIFIPAANLASYPFFLIGLFVIGIGLTILQTASNPYVTILGPAESAAQRISIMGIANKVAGIIGQYIMGGLLLAGTTAATGNDLDKVINPYLVLTFLLAGLAILVSFSKLPDINEAAEAPAVNASGTTRTSVWQFPHLLLGVLAMFLYVGVEVIAGDTIINYGVSQGIALEQAKHFTTYTLYAMLIGYVLGIVTIPKYVSQQKALQLSAILGVLLTLLALVTTGFTSVLCVALLGLANALMWPAIFPLAIASLGKFTKIGSALVVMGIAGGAILPLIYGRMADSMGTQAAYAIALPCYLFILYFAWRGWRVK